VSVAAVRLQPWLAPVGSLFGGAAALRAALYQRGLLSQSRLRGAVISVGNLRVGGSGKTPVVAHVARLLLDAGHPVSILSRGYGRSPGAGFLFVSDGHTLLADAEAAGDEPVMLARRLPAAVVAVGAHRDEVGHAVEERFGSRVHVLDDGFQHLRLARDLDIVCVSMGDLGDRPLPAGWLRETPRALARADVLLLTGDGDEAIERARERLGRERTFRLRRKTLGFFAPDGSPRPAPARPFLLSGIARPERFVVDVSACTSGIAGHGAFPDHHRFTPGEIADAIARARQSGAEAVVTTEKDLTRLAWPGDAPPLLILRIDVAIEDDVRFRARVLAAAARTA
jgi:tetraacyldisaccharide 4'-kinase